MSTLALTPTQRQVLEYALDHCAGSIEWFPAQVKGGARQRVLASLLKLGLISGMDGTAEVCVAVYPALGRACPVEPRSKLAKVIALLQAPEGATLAQMCAATGWQAHSMRGALSGTLKRKLGLAIVSHKTKGEARVYRLNPPAAGAADEDSTWDAEEMRRS